MEEDEINDPNFPKGGLKIFPSYDKHSQENKNEWARDSINDIEKYGIAGTIWSAAYVLQQYLIPSKIDLEFEPPCSIFSKESQISSIIELGSGVGLVGISLAKSLKLNKIQKQIVLTDLENVLSLPKRNIERAELIINDDIYVEALPWGSKIHAEQLLEKVTTISHILCSDLVYFPELLPLLLRTLIHLTNDDKGKNAEIIIGYKIRSLSKEEPFWKAFGVWFDFIPVLFRKNDEKDWKRLGQPDENSNDDIYVFIAKRKSSTYKFIAPTNNKSLMSGHLLDSFGELHNCITINGGMETFEMILLSNSFFSD